MLELLICARSFYSKINVEGNYDSLPWRLFAFSERVLFHIWHDTTDDGSVRDIDGKIQFAKYLIIEIVVSLQLFHHFHNMTCG